MVQAQPIQIQPQPVYLLYDPARRKRKARKKKLDPDPVIVYEPAKRKRGARRRRLDPARAGGKAIVDSIIDGFGIGGVVGSMPFGEQVVVGGLTVKDLAGGILAGAYEKVYMKRGWTPTIIGFAIGCFASRIFNWLKGVRG